MGFNIKNIFIYLTIIIFSLVIGWGYGVFTTTKNNFVNEVTCGAGTIITTDVNVLNYLQSGSTQKAIDMLEQDLDMQIMKFYLGIPGDETKRFITETTLKRAKKYRLQYPRSSDNKEFDHMVNEVLSRVDITNWKGK